MAVTALLPLLLTGGGVWFLWRLRAFFLMHPRRVLRVLRSAFRDGRGAHSYTALMLALAGTLGVGNITGVAVGILLGGPGSVLWLLFSALFATVLKFAEATVTASGPYPDGMIGVIRHTLPFGKGAGALYALLCLGLCFLMGGALQCRSAVRAAEGMFSFPVALGTLLFLSFVLFCILGGAKRIMQKTAFLIPIATILYIIICMITIIKGIDRLPHTVSLIISSAFSADALGGGILGFFSSRAVREGFCRGLLSNEAGAGTSTLAHTENAGIPPAAEGVLGMCEVFFDTVLLCMLSALSLLIGAGEPTAFADGFSYLAAAFSSSLGAYYRFPLFFCFFIFAASTSLCWFYYGNAAWDALFPKRKERRGWFSLFFLLAIGAGGICDDMLLFCGCDILLFAAGVLSMSALLLRGDTVRREALAAGLITERGSRREARGKRALRQARHRSWDG